ncbi:MAG: hypothetical protein AAFO04_15645 [Cyanobacteria bacterium J06592_8]
MKEWLRLSAIAVFITCSISPKVAVAQSACTAPEAGEYLLLIVSQTQAEQDLARRTLPNDVESEVCRYLEDVVTRVGGFEEELIAKDWAAYVKDNSGLRTYVVKPDTVSQRPPTRQSTNRSPASELETEPRSAESPRTRQRPRPQPTPQETSFNPRRLGSGYAILVDYLNQPELATEIAEITGVNVGLASYGQRPYLLVTQTNNLQTATSTLQTLSRRGFFVLMVESRRVILIDPTVNE